MYVCFSDGSAKDTGETHVHNLSLKGTLLRTDHDKKAPLTGCGTGCRAAENPYKVRVLAGWAPCGGNIDSDLEKTLDFTQSFAYTRHTL